MLGLEEYTKEFKKGLNYVLYDSEQESRIEPTLDESNLESIGYYDGYQYGEYLELTGQTMSISAEQLMAEIDKRHTKALDKYRKYEDRYVRYKSGFVEGKLAILEKIMLDDKSFNELPEVNDEDLISVGYYDGYSYFLNDFVQNGMIRRNNDIKTRIEEISRACFKQRENNLSKEKGQNK